jgi:hypothetical protein
MVSFYKNKKIRIAFILLLLIAISAIYLYVKHDTGNEDAIILSNAIPNRHSNPILVGPLFKNDKFIRYLGESYLYESHEYKLDIVNLTASPIKRESKLGGENYSIVSVAIQNETITYVEQSAHWKNLFVIAEPNAIFTTRHDNSDLWDRKIHSLSISHSGKFLAFMVSSDNVHRNWENQNLWIYNFDQRAIQKIWRGSISGPTNVMKCIQPLCWSFDDREVLLSTSNGKIISVNIYNGEQRKFCKAYLPIGFTNEDVLLVLREKGFFTRNYWSIIEYNVNTKQEKQLVLFKGPEEMRAPVLSPDKRYISLIAKIYPEERAMKGIFYYTVFFDLQTHEWGLAKAEIIAWSEKKDSEID